MKALALSLFAASVVAVALLAAEGSGGGLNLTAKTANVAGAPDDVRIEIVRWSTEEERERLMAAWNLKPAAGGAGKAGRAGKAAGKAGKAGKGAAKGGGAAEASKATPEAELAKALQEAATVGYLWSSETAGYALRYAGRVQNGDGSQRVILITQRRLGAMNPSWTPTASGAPNHYEFSLIELRLDAKGAGEGKASILGNIAADEAAGIVALENYGALPTLFSNVSSGTGRE